MKTKIVLTARGRPKLMDVYLETLKAISEVYRIYGLDISQDINIDYERRKKRLD